jgi:16S rRNA (guanine966-N2)-methyltransferase
VRETLFNWLGQDLTGWSVLDAYGGTGALGFEAASRGAARVCLLELDTELLQSLRQVKQRLGAAAVDVLRADAQGWMRQATPQAFDLIFLDPPFAADVFLDALRLALPLLRAKGLVYLEADRAFSAEELARCGYRHWREGRAGAVHYCLLEAVVPVPSAMADLSPPPESP